ncbi:hypothetical protein BC827DRAFT_327041 [Russula dissimulans]|nr:hypothetical protein BC827DRAFT_327041 [Russula dissimulans]
MRITKDFVPNHQVDPVVAHTAKPQRPPPPPFNSTATYTMTSGSFTAQFCLKTCSKAMPERAAGMFPQLFECLGLQANRDKYSVPPTPTCSWKWLRFIFPILSEAMVTFSYDHHGFSYYKRPACRHP